MRVVEPNQFRGSLPTKKPRSRRLKLVSVVVLILVGVWLMSSRYAASPSNNYANIPALPDIASDNTTDTDMAKTGQNLRQFTDNEFKVFYDNLLQANLERVENPPVISGNDIADARIRKMAEDRGYRLRSSPSVSLVKVDGYPLHEVVAKPWQELKTASLKAGLQMTIVSAYRSVSEQRQLFLSRLSAAGATIEQIAEGLADEKVNEVLITTSIPGYSKHHTGYTFDLLCAGYEFENFKNSPCNTWLMEDNYKVAKEHGFIPSYPPLSDSQGPNPEAWEYVWVGTDLLYE